MALGPNRDIFFAVQQFQQIVLIVAHIISEIKGYIKLQYYNRL